LLLATAALAASAAEVGGVKLDDRVRVQTADLQLNGAGVRTRYFFDVYAIGLYLAEKKADPAAVVALPGNKRVAIHMLRDVGAARSQKRLEDDRLLLGKGLFSDDRVLPRQAWMAIVRSPHAHAKILSIDLKVPGVLAAWSMAELRADKVGHIPFPPLFKRADG